MKFLFLNGINMKQYVVFTRILLLTLTFILLSFSSNAKKLFTLDDAMKFKSLHNAVISENGFWVAYHVSPDRGDPTGYIQSTTDSSKFEIERATRPVFTRDDVYTGFTWVPKSLDIENAKTPKDRPKNGFVLVKNTTGTIDKIKDVKKFEFSDDSKWCIYHKFENDEEKSEKMKKKPIGSELVIRHLFSQTEIRVDYVTEYTLDSAGAYIFYSVSSPDGERDGLYLRRLLETFAPEVTVNKAENTLYSGLAYAPKTKALGYISSTLTKEGVPKEGTLMIWEEIRAQQYQIALTPQTAPKGWYIPYNNTTKWSDDGLSLFIGLKPDAERDTIETKPITYTDDTFYNIDSVRTKSSEFVWHWDDPLISSNQVNWWNKSKDRTFTSVYNLRSKRFFQLADSTCNNVVAADNSIFTIGYDNTPYQKEITYDGWFFDLYVFNLATGAKKKIATRISESAHLSPQGKFVLFFQNKHWHIYDTNKDLLSNITKDIPIPFYDVDNDIPAEAGSYGIGAWFEDDMYVLINEKYDFYKFFTTDPGSFINMSATIGRKHQLQFRYTNLDPRKKVIMTKDTFYVHVYSEKLKCTNMFFFEEHISGGINVTTESGAGLYEEKTFTILGRSNNNKLIFSRESYDEFPDIWLADNPLLDNPIKITNINPQMKDLKWGTTEIVRWVTPLGDSLDGYIIKPDGFDPKKKYPVLVYYYERFSSRTFTFYQPRINHRPIYQLYTSDDYLVFVPDVVYKTGRPGYDATDAILSGLKVLIDRGIADPDRLCIQGHSWAGYQTAFVITQTDMFKAASAGAPVGNMTSAYSQIRTESGLARQFQYEKQQSRIGGNLWDSLDNYMNNSPVFLARNINTPLLILHGNEDEAVPFSQGVELYLALRRLEKPCVLVEYNKEPHHPRKYENKLDWQIKMKEWFDHYVLGKEAPKWITDGKPYYGK